MNKNQTSEQGQAIILLALAVIGLVGITALVIDGGMVYSDRRHAQSASDAASLAGGGFAALGLENYGIYYENFNCNNSELRTSNPNSLVSKAITTAELRAASNSYTSDVSTGDEVWVTVDCEDCLCSGDEKFLDITTHIRRTTKTSLIHFVYDGEAVNEVVSTVRVRPRTPFLFGNAIVALNDAPCQGESHGAVFHGNVDVGITTGGIWTNGCLRGVGNIDVEVDDGGINYVGEVIGADLFDPSPRNNPNPIPPEDYYVAPPECGHAAAHNVNASAIIDELDPGLYCISGDVMLNGAADTVVGEGVTLYFLDGSLTINGNATVQLTAPNESPDPSPALPGILIMTAPGNSSRIQINGNSDSIFTGTVLAPESDIDYLGNGDTDTYNTQIIGWNVQAGGNADLVMDFFDNRLLSHPGTIDLKE